MFTKNRLVLSIYSITICLGAFLMFLIQPVIGKIVTPQYGGGSQIWALCLLFFQLALLGGYALIYLLSKLSIKKQGILYVIFLGISLIFLHIPTGDNWIPKNQEHPILNLLSLLMIYLAIPAVLLSTISTIMQNWYRITTNKNPYYLYSVSNIGAVSALLAYPTLIEPNLSVNITVKLWSLGYWLLVLFAFISSVLMYILVKRSENNSLSNNNDQEVNAPKIVNCLYWILLSAAGTILLISFTNHITQDIAPVPLLWIIPLTLYLMSFIFCFSHEKVYSRPFFILAGSTLVIMSILLSKSFSIIPLLSLNFITLFALCMICHGELYNNRPHSKHLPVFYLTIAFGGALGGVFINFIAPIIFNSYMEYSLILIIMLLFSVFISYKYKLYLFASKSLTKTAYIGLIIYAIVNNIYSTCFYNKGNEVLAMRNFYGVLNVNFDKKSSYKTLVHGSTRHGAQFIDPKTGNYLNIPTLYFSRNSAVGVTDAILREHNNGKALKIGIVGLGVGTVAAYGQKGDEITFYEIDPKVKYIAENYFGFLKDSKAKVNIIMGDGRLSLKEQSPQNYNILMIDAFNSDNIPVHLLTREAIKLYLSHIADEGVILLHVSNKYLNLYPVIENLALDLNLKATAVYSTSGFYAVLSKDDRFLNTLVKSNILRKLADKYSGLDFDLFVERLNKKNPKVGIWTDNYTNFLSIFHPKVIKIRAYEEIHR